MNRKRKRPNRTTSLTKSVSHEPLVQMILNIEEMLADDGMQFTQFQADLISQIADIGKKSLAKGSSPIDMSMLSRAEKYSIASRIISDISAEWDDAPNAEQWQKEHVEAYDSSMSFDELAAEVRSVEFKTLPAKTEA